MATTSMSPLVREARTLAGSLLAHDPQRLDHVRGAGDIAGMAAGAIGVAGAESVVAAALLHDIGYSPSVARTGFHPLDGALFLAREGWPDAVVLLVAHHSSITSRCWITCRAMPTTSSRTAICERARTVSALIPGSASTTCGDATWTERSFRTRFARPATGCCSPLQLGSMRPSAGPPGMRSKTRAAPRRPPDR